tara:strand:+ start:511 stop:4026 length:3516 start_codon:yes stop_codon:yes gene_type:complete
MLPSKNISKDSMKDLCDRAVKGERRALDLAARKLRHLTRVRDRGDGSWIRQIYQNTFQGQDARDELVRLIGSDSRAIQLLQKMMSSGLIRRANGKNDGVFVSSRKALYRWIWDEEDPLTFAERKGSKNDSNNLDWEFPAHVKANSHVLGTAIGDWLENALNSGTARDVLGAITAARQRVLDAGRFNGPLFREDRRFEGCYWKTTRRDKSNNIEVQTFSGPAATSADYSCVRVTGFLQQPPEIAARAMGTPKFREKYGEMFKKDCKYVDVLEKTRTRIRLTDRRTRCRSPRRIVDRAAAIENIPSLHALSEKESQFGGRFFSSAVLPQLPPQLSVSVKNKTKTGPGVTMDDETDVFYSPSSSDNDSGDSSDLCEDMIAEPLVLDKPATLPSLARSKTWQDAASRENGNGSYQFGDVSRIVLQKAKAQAKALRAYATENDLRSVVDSLAPHASKCIFDRFFGKKTGTCNTPLPLTDADDVEDGHVVNAVALGEGSGDNDSMRQDTESSQPRSAPPPIEEEEEENEDDKDDPSDTKEEEKDDEGTREALAAMANLCILYRTHKQVSNISRMLTGSFDSVVLNDTFMTSDNVYALWGTSVRHKRTPPRSEYNRMEVLFFCQVIEPIAGYPQLSRLTVTYQFKSNIVGALQHYQLNMGIGKGMREFADVQRAMTRPQIKEAFQKLHSGSSVTVPHASGNYEANRKERVDGRTGNRSRTLSGLMSPLKPAGVQLMDFELLSVCGRGGFGKVLKVRRLGGTSPMGKEETFYAMKVISKNQMIKKKHIGHVIVERQILSTLSSSTLTSTSSEPMKICPFIVRLFWAFQTRTHLFLVMEFVAGGDLLTRLVRRGRLTLNLSRIYAAEIYLALSHLHKCGITYRDMKPENLLITTDGHLKLADFGVSYIHKRHRSDEGARASGSRRRSSNEKEGPRSFVGTEIYMAPELISQAIRSRRRKAKSSRSAKPYDGQALDWWGFGIVLYNMLTARHPFVTGGGKSGNSRLETLQNILDASFVPKHLLDVGRASRSAAELLRALFERDPTRRASAKAIRSHSFLHKIDWKAVNERNISLPADAVSERGDSNDGTGMTKSSKDENDMSLLSAIQSTVYHNDQADGRVPVGNFTDAKNSFYHEMDLFAGFSYNRDFDESSEDVFDIMASKSPSSPRVSSENRTSPYRN